MKCAVSFLRLISSKNEMFMPQNEACGSQFTYDWFCCSAVASCCTRGVPVIRYACLSNNSITTVAKGPGVGHKIVSDTKQMTKERKKKKKK